MKLTKSFRNGSRILLIYVLVATIALPQSYAIGPGGMPSVGTAASAPSLAPDMNFGVNIAPDAGGSMGGFETSDSVGFAQGFGGGSTLGKLGPGARNGVSQRGSEFISGYYPGAVLIPVYITGSIKYAGLHYVPTRTNLLKFIALAGGTQNDADLSNIVIKRTTGDDKKEDVSEQMIKFDAEKYMETPGTRGPLLQENDLISIPRQKPSISNNTTLIVGFISTLLAIGVSSIVINQALKK